MAAITISPVDIESRKKLDLRAGASVRVWQKIQEKGKTRLQAFEGLILAVKHGKESGSTFTVRKVIDGVGVERIFPLYSPLVDKVEILKRSKVRRAKLYYIRDQASREVKRQLRKLTARGKDENTDTKIAIKEEKKEEKTIEATETK